MGDHTRVLEAFFTLASMSYVCVVYMLVYLSVTKRIRKCTNIIVAFTLEYF